jgi:Bacterial RNA polymerase, alpha chain C terminal domain
MSGGQETRYDIANLLLSVRAENCVKALGISDARELARYDETTLLKQPHLGRRTLWELEQALARLGLRLGVEASGPDKVAPVAETNDRRLADLCLGARANNALRAAGIFTLRELIKRDEAKLLRQPNLGTTSLAEIKRRLMELDLRLGMSNEEIKQHAATLTAVPATSSGGADEVREAAPNARVDGRPQVIDEELEQALAATVPVGHHLIVAARLGWSGQPIPTLAVLGSDTAISGLPSPVTRERTRQIVEQAEKRLSRFLSGRAEGGPILAAKQFLQQRCPMSRAMVGSALVDAGLAKTVYDYDVLKHLAELSRFDWNFAELFSNKQVIVCTTTCSEMENKEYARAILDALRGRPFARLSDVKDGFHRTFDEGYARAIVNVHPSMTWLDELKSVFWRNAPLDTTRVNKAIFVCGKIFSLKRESTISELENALRRSRTVDDAPGSETLSNILSQTSLFEIDGDRVIAKPGTRFDNLSRTDFKLLLAARGLGQTVQFIDLRDNLVRDGLTSNHANVLITAYSPFLTRIARGIYRLAVDPDKIDWSKVSASSEPSKAKQQSDLELMVVIGSRARMTGKINAPEVPDRTWSIHLDSGVQTCISSSGRIEGLQPILKMMSVPNGSALRLQFDLENSILSLRMEPGPN